MFKVGSVYQFRIIEDGEEGRSVFQVLEVENNLITIFNPHMSKENIILNTASLNFVSAELIEEGAGADYFKDDDFWLNTPVEEKAVG